MRTILITTLLTAVAAGPARADLLGEVIKPFAAVTEQYDSNVFRVKDRAQLQALVGDDRLADFITVATVGTGLHYAVSRQELNASLQRDFIRFSHYSQQNVARDDLRGNLALHLFDQLTLRLDGGYTRAPQPRADYRASDVNQRREIAGGGTMAYQTQSGVGVEGGYRRIEVDYSLPQYRANEYTVDRYTGACFYQLSAEARIAAIWQRDDTRYPLELVVGPVSVNNSSVADSFRLSLNKAVSPRTTLSGTVGYQQRRHAQSSGRDFSGLVGSATIRYGLTGKLGLLLNWERQLYEETYANRIYSSNQLVAAGFTYDLSSKVKTTIMNRLAWKTFEDLPASGVLPRRDFTHELQTGIEWSPVDKLTFNAGYQYASRNSDEEVARYTAHTGTIGVAYRF